MKFIKSVIPVIFVAFVIYMVFFVKTPNTDCKGIGGYNIGDVYNTDISYKELKASNFWIKADKFNPVGVFDQWAEIRITPSSHIIVAIKLIGPVIEDKDKYAIGPSMEVLQNTVNAICKHYNEKPIPAESFVLSFRKDITLKTGYYYEKIFNFFQQTNHDKRIANHYYLCCYTNSYSINFIEEPQQMEESKQAKAIDLTGLN